ncbi:MULTISPECIES: hypothetical protein [unclassified Polaromonas]|uniref:hypothetical protein n=1 Tax=unclassified Polaromonas TaxID=2638319 RepID=UPI0018C9143E|nr:MULTISPECIES: hypothetical protein [unclassified Polaromonas]MBG6074084.1 hypothetical protein [Polaromonas sp. CG_9.7]MBG6116081.1 hypothetical protein [Polaromonas sp. CG_9.2]MDH6186513.1 hypothetical protein [Polaromonas sp. CG_23.6]
MVIKKSGLYSSFGQAGGRLRGCMNPGRYKKCSVSTVFASYAVFQACPKKICGLDKEMMQGLLTGSIRLV